MTQRRSILLAIGIVVVVVGGIAAFLAPRGHQAPSLPVTAASVSPSVTPVASPPAVAVQRVAPTTVIIPSIGVNAPVMPVGLCPAAGLDCDGVVTGGLATPPLKAGNLAGWWDGGAAPGQNGPAVIVGHVDNPNPAVFWNLDKMVAGESIEIVLANGKTVSFTVTSTQEASKDSFPTQAVYGSTPQPTLRLVTCGGAFVGTHYVDNFIVYATENVGS